eukprot:scaffold19910_cov51-Attheya_sp.AAC.5
MDFVIAKLGISLPVLSATAVVTRSRQWDHAVRDTGDLQQDKLSQEHEEDDSVASLTDSESSESLFDDTFSDMPSLSSSSSSVSSSLTVSFAPDLVTLVVEVPKTLPSERSLYFYSPREISAFKEERRRQILLFRISRQGGISKRVRFQKGPNLAQVVCEVPTPSDEERRALHYSEEELQGTSYHHFMINEEKDRVELLPDCRS